MANIDTPFNNFARAKIDHDMMGRFDLPVYQSGVDLDQNFITNFKGNAIYRCGYESIYAFQDCAFIEFKFNNAQNYILVLFNTTMQFLSYDSNGNFGWVLNGGGTTLQVTTPWTLAQSKNIGFSQNADVMIMCNNAVAPYKLTRVSANSFTLATYTRTNDPFTGAGLYPACCLFYKGRLFYAAPTNKVTTVYASVAGSYFDHTATPVTATSALTFSIADITQPILWLFPGDNSLIVGASDGIVAVNGGGIGIAVTAATIDATLTSAPPCNSAFPFKKEGLMFYAGIDGRNIYYFSYDILSSQFTASDANFISYDITKGGILKIRYKKDRNDLFFCTTNSTAQSMLSCNFNLKENIIGWHENTTSGNFKDVAVITDNTGVPQLFALTLRNGTYYIEHQTPFTEFAQRVNFFTGTTDQGGTAAEQRADDIAYNRYVAEQLKNCNYLDNSLSVDDLQNNVITFNGVDTIAATSNVFSSGDIGKDIVYKTLTGYESGRFTITGYTDAKHVTVDVTQAPTSNNYQFWYRTFEVLSGLSQYNGQTVSVVADGGYLNDYLITGGTVDLGKQVTSATIGYKYKGILKSFCLGMQIQAVNTQITMKAISGFSVRCVASAGLKVGSSLYKLEPVQQLSQNDINYLPPIPIDGTKDVAFSDTNERDKYFYVVQDEPLPATVVCVMLTTNYTVAK